MDSEIKISNFFYVLLAFPISLVTLATLTLVHRLSYPLIGLVLGLTGEIVGLDFGMIDYYDWINWGQYVVPAVSLSVALTLPFVILLKKHKTEKRQTKVVYVIGNLAVALILFLLFALIDN